MAYFFSAGLAVVAAPPAPADAGADVVVALGDIDFTF
jgi:hypothetical protein